jgi:hypothetical protein
MGAQRFYPLNNLSLKRKARKKSMKIHQTILTDIKLASRYLEIDTPCQ